MRPDDSYGMELWWFIACIAARVTSSVANILQACLAMKMTEWVIAKCIYDRNHLLCETQHCFIKAHSILLESVNDWTLSVRYNKVVSVAFDLQSCIWQRRTCKAIYKLFIRVTYLLFICVSYCVGWLSSGIVNIKFVLMSVCLTWLNCWVV